MFVYYRLKGLCVCVFMCVCVCVRESKQGFFHALFWFHTGKSGIYSPPKPVHRAPVRTSCQKPTPAAFPLCLFQEIITTRLRLRSVPRPLFTLHLYSVFFVYLPPFFLLLLFTLTPHVCHKKDSPLQCHLPLSQCFQCGESGNCLRSCCALTTPEPCRAF